MIELDPIQPHYAAYRYIIDGDPIPLARARHGNKNTWDSQKQLKFGIGVMLRSQHGAKPIIQSPVRLEIDFYFLPAQSMSAKKKQERIGYMHSIKPDLSNLIKFVEDIATGIIYHDDCLIAAIHATKQYDIKPRTEFTIIEL